MSPKRLAQRRTVHERRWILAFALCAALRVLWSAAVFPFLSNIDEPAHYDLVLKYARGAIPHGLEPYSQELAEVYAHYVSPEFMGSAEDYGGRFPDPPLSAAEIAWRLGPSNGLKVS